MADNIQELLAQAPPDAPTANDADATKAANEATAAKALADSAKQPSAPAAQPAPSPASDPRFAMYPNAGKPGTLAHKFASALIDTYTNPATAAMAAAPGGGTRSLFLASAQALHGYSAELKAKQAAEAGLPAAEAAPAGQPARSMDDRTKAALSGSLDMQAPSKPSAGNRVGNALRGVTNALSDAAVGSQPGSFASGFATNQRDLERRQSIATANAQMLNEQGLTHKLGAQALDTSIADNTKVVNNLIAPPPDGGRVEGSRDGDGVTSDDLNRMLNTIDPITKLPQFNSATQTVFPTGKIEVGKYADGSPRYRATYTIMTLRGKVAVSDENRALIKDMDVKDLPEGMTLEAHDLNGLIQQALTVKASRQALAIGTKKTDEELRKVQISKDAQTIFQNSTINKVLKDSITSDPKDVFAPVRAFNTLSTNDMLNKDASLPPNWATAYREAYDQMHEPGSFKTLEQEYMKKQQANADTTSTMLKDIEEHPEKIEGKTASLTPALKSIILDQNKPEEERNRAKKQLAIVTATHQLELSGDVDKEDAKARAKQRAQAVNNPNNLQGEAFIKTLTAGRANMFRSFIEGRLPLSASALERTKDGQQLLDDLNAAYPDGVDASKAPTYVKMRENFASGKDATALNASNASIRHAGEMYDKLGSATAGYLGGAESFFGLNKSGREAAAITQPLASELGKLYSGGVVTEGEMKEWEDKLSPFTAGQTVSKLKTNLGEFISLLGGKLEGYQDQWDRGVPTAMIKPPNGGIASRDIADIYKKITGKDLGVRDIIEPRQARPQGVGADWKQLQFSDGLHWVSPDKAAAAIKAGAKEVQ